MRILYAIILLIHLSISAKCQQTGIFSQFFYNKIIENPAAAGSQNMPVLTAFHRQQWSGLEGAPSTQSLSFHAPLFAERVGLGLTLLNDRIGFFNGTYVNLAYAYRIALGKGKLAIGMHGSYLHFRADWAAAQTVGGRPDPTAGTERLTPVFNAGAGVYYESAHFFAGAAVPQALEKGLTAQSAGLTGDFNGTTPHVFLTTGGIIPLSDKLKFRPAFATRWVKNAPVNTDVYLSLGFPKAVRVWIGGTYRWSFSQIPSMGDAVVATLQYQISQKLKAGAAYDLALGSVRRFGPTFELMIEYAMTGDRAGVRNPRFFW